METLTDNIRLVTFVAPVVADEDSEPTGNIIDTKEIAAEAGSPRFDGALIRAVAGTFGADLTGIAIEIQESDNADGSSGTVAEGGASQSLSEAGALTFQVKRSKRYLKAVTTMTAGGAGDTAPLAIVGILHNWAHPLPLV